MSLWIIREGRRLIDLIKNIYNICRDKIEELTKEKEIDMLKITEYEGSPYMATSKDMLPRRDWIKFEWDRGYITMTKYKWEKLSQRKKNIILKLGIK